MRPMPSSAKATQGRSEVPWNELGALLDQARQAMTARGGAKLGDKTVLDAIDALADAISGLDHPAEVRSKAAALEQPILDRFRGLPNKVGRARMFAEASVGLDDPGMLAFMKLTSAIARG
jgi:dihydroxyacetone kinase-like protein